MTNEEVQQKSLELLKDIHEFCEENGIFYVLCGGSLIGAVRHNGFIPWDDDIDIALPRPDYDRFIKTYKSKNGYKLFSREVEGGEGVFFAFARVCDVEKTYIDTSLNPWSKYDTGVWIDVMPIEGAYSDEAKEKKRWKKAHYAWKQSVWARKALIDIKTCDSPLEYLKNIFCKVFYKNRYSFTDKLISICKECDYDKSTYFTDISITHYGMREYNSKSIMSDRILHKFEDAEYYIPIGYDQWLRHIYGDYMKLPPVEERIFKHGKNKYYWK